MTLVTIHSIIETGTIDANDIADKFLKWFRNAEYTATGDCFDIGRTTSQALSKFEFKQDIAVNCGEFGEYDNENGSLMKILPLSYYIYYKQIKEDKKTIALIEFKIWNTKSSKAIHQDIKKLRAEN
ncbi:ADP-ribosylglycohydrolase family protein [bacterium]|nr:ADP-ribosylglycohydrolase family protein [bacterium]